MSDYIDFIHHRDVAKVSKKKAPKSRDSGTFQVRKRMKYENEVIKCQTKLHAIPIEYGDRFIPRRYVGQQSIIPNNNSIIDENDNDILLIKKQPFYWRLHNYRIMLADKLDLADSTRMLEFRDTTTMQSINQNSCNNIQPTKIEHKISSKSAEALDWPCKPRAKPLAYNDSTHDMPDFDQYDNANNIIDWSSKSQIAASFEKSLVLWGPPSEDGNDITTILYKIEHVSALKYGPDGLCLALGVNGIRRSTLQIWDVTNKMSIRQKVAFTFPKEAPTECVRCIEWSKFNKHIICGMSTGTVFFISYTNNFDEMDLLHRYEGHATAVISNIKHSIHSAYIAITDSLGNLSVLRNNVNFEVNLTNQQRAHHIAWHPWKESYLLIGYKSPAAIHLLDMKTKTTIANYCRTDSHHTLCALSINPLSAEVLASFSHVIGHETHSDILVMASMNRIVDNLSAHQDAVYFLLWDPTGTRVATAGRDESLNIWNFFGKSQKKANELIRIHGSVKVPKTSKLSLNNAFMMFR